jgi:hypothetical protein
MTTATMTKAWVATSGSADTLIATACALTLALVLIAASILAQPAMADAVANAQWIVGP